MFRVGTPSRKGGPDRPPESAETCATGAGQSPARGGAADGSPPVWNHDIVRYHPPKVLAKTKPAA
jgi:hypothetical protein